jgi:hypothetical protein
MIFSRTLKLLVAACALGAAASASTVFNFDNDNLGTATTFTDTVDGLSATFSSTADPGGFVLYPSFFETLTGNVLGDPGPAGLDGLSLDVAFSGELNAVTLDFATSDFGTPSPLTISAYQNSQLVGSIDATGMVPANFTFPEGEITFQGSPFNNIVISSTATDFAVDNIAASVVATPEPGLFPLLAFGLAVIALASVQSKYRRERSANQ